MNTTRNRSLVFARFLRAGTFEIRTGGDIANALASIDSIADELEATVNPRAPRELLCMVCGSEYPVWFAPNDVWNPVMRRADGSDEVPFICPTCFALAAAAKGELSAFVLSIEQPRPPHDDNSLASTRTSDKDAGAGDSDGGFLFVGAEGCELARQIIEASNAPAHSSVNETLGTSAEATMGRMDERDSSMGTSE